MLGQILMTNMMGTKIFLSLHFNSACSWYLGSYKFEISVAGQLSLNYWAVHRTLPKLSGHTRLTKNDFEIFSDNFFLLCECLYLSVNYTCLWLLYRPSPKLIKPPRIITGQHKKWLSKNLHLHMELLLQIG